MSETVRSIMVNAVVLAAFVFMTWGILHLLSNHTSFFYSIRGMRGSTPPVGSLLDPHQGLWFTARNSVYRDESLTIAALKEPVTVKRDDRGVPHIFAGNDRDAIIASGYVVAQDRLFQLDFIPRAASGSLAQIFGSDLITTDRYLRSTGMDWAAKRNLDSVEIENTVERDLAHWFAAGVNAYIDALKPHELPLEFRLIGYEPDTYEPIDVVRVLQFMSYDLSFRTDDLAYGRLRELLSKEDYDLLFPRESFLYVPIVPEPAGAQGSSSLETRQDQPQDWSLADSALNVSEDALGSDDRFPGFKPGKGSNNWAVTGDRSATGRAILAGDMHLELTLPAIWYEIRLSTPSMNTRGVTIPGAPLPVEAFNERHGWAFTNTGADQIDHYRLVVDSSATAYRFNEKWLPFELVIDTIHVRGSQPVADTLRLTRYGPVMGWPNNPVAIQWTAHKRARTLKALWEMHHAADAEEFQEALRFWDSPMQNVLYADTSGTIAIRSSGFLPLRRAGHGAGLLDGTNGTFDWIGRVPFDELPFAQNPEQGYLASANQLPAGPWYPHYLGHNWYRSYRSIRINDLLSSRDRHGVADMMAYQSDVHVVQRDLFVPMLDTLSNLSEDARFVKRLFLEWDGRAHIDQSASLALDEYLSILKRLAWDEFLAQGVRLPREEQLYRLLTEDPESRWLDIASTDLKVETGPDLLRMAIEQTADSLRAKYGWDQEAWRWDLHHRLVIRHLTKSSALSALDVGPVSYPGFANTLSPAAGRTTTNSASWRMIVDFSSSPPVAFGVYPGGQSGNPFSRHYDSQVAMFTHFGYYRLGFPGSAHFAQEDIESTTVELKPVNPPQQETSP
jgi:penicillin amidase